MRKTFLTFCFLLSAFILPAPATPLSGTLTVGPTGDYLSIGSALVDIRTQTLGGALVLELQTNYASTVETFPLTFSNLTTTAANTLTLRPQLGATNLLISSSNSLTMDLNTARFVTIDGRPDGAGTNKELTIGNTKTNGVAVRFIKAASNNTLRHLTLQSVNILPSSGTVVFSSGVFGGDGNNNNIIDTCDIRDGVTTPQNGIYSSGDLGPSDNSGNLVTNCNIYNFHAVSRLYAAGIWIDRGNANWTITGNSFYQTTIRPATTNSSIIPILITNFSSNSRNIITNNFIGGSAPKAAGAAWTTTGAAFQYRFVGILVAVASQGLPTRVEGNVISNMVWSGYGTSTFPDLWTGILLQNDVSNPLLAMGNSIGNSVGTNSISVTNASTVGTVYGISSFGAALIANNAIGSITTSGGGSAVAASITGIQNFTGPGVISNNIVGSPSTASSLNASTAQRIAGIVTSNATSANITGNLVANLNNAFGGQVLGIFSSDGVNTIAGNTIRNLTAASFNTGMTTSASVLGIGLSSTLAGQTIFQNTVHSLANTALLNFVAINVIGIYYSGTQTGNSVITRNLVHSLATTGTNASANLYGMHLSGGKVAVKNNIVNIGRDAGGASTAVAGLVRGIYDSNSSGGRNYLHNTVLLDGIQTSGNRNSAAFFLFGAMPITNNIFVNSRNNNGSTVKHCAIQIGDVVAANNNLYFASGSGGLFGIYAGVNQTNLTDWQATTGQDAASLYADPLFVNPTGDAASLDLHISANSPVINAGLPLASVTNDFEGDLRSATAPTIGADEFNYALIPGYNQLTARSLGGGTNVLSFLGLPGSNYTLEMATNLVPPVLWQPLLTNSTAVNGSLFFTNVTALSPVFYRTRYVP